jgi:hypothetical protein
LHELEQTERVEDFMCSFARRVIELADRAGYLKLLGDCRQESLGMEECAYRAPADCGYLTIPKMKETR